MPLTFAHPAAIVPIYRRNKTPNLNILSALIIGSIVPDYVLFLTLPFSRDQSHSFLGMFWFCLPAGLISYFMFQKMLMLPVLNLLPPRVEACILHSRAESKDVPTFLELCFYILLGVITHLVWDSFTHDNGFFVVKFPVLQTILFSIFDYDVYIYKILQHGSSLLGMSLLAYWFIRWYRATYVTARPEIQNAPSSGMRLLIVISLLTVTILVLFFFGNYNIRNISGILDIRDFLVNILAGSGTTLLIVLCIYSIAWNLFPLQKSQNIL